MKNVGVVKISQIFVIRMPFTIFTLQLDHISPFTIVLPLHYPVYIVYSLTD